MTIKKLIEAEIKMHPKAELVDFYKLFFQAVYGPKHLLQDKKQAYEYFMKELKVSKLNKNIQDISLFENDFIRIDLGLVSNPIIFFDALIKSAEITTKLFMNDWIELWKKIADELKNYNLNNFEAELKRINESISNRKYVFHHSKTYKNLYNPHYRVLSKKLWGKTQKTENSY